MVSSIEGLAGPKELNDTDSEVPHIMSPSKEDSVLETIVDNMLSSYNRSV